MPSTPPAPRTPPGETAPAPSTPADPAKGEDEKKTKSRATRKAGTKTGIAPRSKPRGSAGLNDPLPADAEGMWALPERWMDDWIDAAIRTGSVSEACRATEVSLVKVDRARSEVPAFRKACAIFDVVADLLIQDAVRTLAMACNPIGLRFYFQCMRPAIFATIPNPEPGPEPEEIPPEEAGRFIRRALEASGDMLDEDEDL